MSTKPGGVVSASEVASWAWCPEAWRLGALGEEPENHAALARGNALHAGKSRFEVLSRRAVSVGVGLLAAAVFVVVVWYALIRGGG